jgi:starch phosphorylase
MTTPVTAYFTMEIGLDSAMSTYSGGLGILAGDTIRSAADLDIPMVAVSLLYRQGYFHQRLDARGHQSEEPAVWSIEDFLEPLEPRIHIDIENRRVSLRAWRYDIQGVSGFNIPVYLLDTDLDENAPKDRTLTDVLYGGDTYHRLCQEVILGIGGVRMLRALGHEKITCFHMNEGHSALLVLPLLEEYVASTPFSEPLSSDAIEAVRTQCVFTTHTPIAAGHDQFSIDLAKRVLGTPYGNWLQAFGQTQHLHMTELALYGSRYANGVSAKHGDISAEMFPNYPLQSITNGVHPSTWVAPSFQTLYDRYVRQWRRDPLLLRHAVRIPSEAIWSAHKSAKHTLIKYVNREGHADFDPDVMTFGFARRATGYKRAALIFDDLDRLRTIAEEIGPLQLVFTGKAHPRDEGGKAGIQRIHAARDALQGVVQVVYLPNYDMASAFLLCSGVDVWLNTPRPPMEASGTSGMKAALNGIPSFSVLDGWWIEGHIEGVTGWAIGGRRDGEPRMSDDESEMSDDETDAAHAQSFYTKLSEQVLPCFYQNRERFIEMMRSAITINGSFFTTHRMVRQYVHHAYRLTQMSSNNA